MNGVLALIRNRLAGADVPVRVGIEAAGHYHRPLLAPSVWPAGWQVLELNPAHVAEQRRVQGRRRVKTDALDLETITELVLAGRGIPVTAHEAVIGELGAWAAHRTRRVLIRTATKNKLLGQLDLAFPGLTLALPDVLSTAGGMTRGHGPDYRRAAEAESTVVGRHRPLPAEAARAAGSSAGGQPFQ